MGTVFFQLLSTVFLFVALLAVPKGIPAMDEIQCNNRSLRTVRADILVAVRKGNTLPTLFQFAGKLVRVHQGDYGSYLEPLTLDALQHHLDCWASFGVRRKGANGTSDFSACPPPLEFVRNIMAMPEWDEKAFPAINRISTVPFFNSIGTLVMEPGYNPAAKVWYEPGGLVVQAVPPDPTDDEVKEAVALLVNEYLGDFPFEGEADKANALAYLLTPFIREMVNLIPMLIVDAPTVGTGKGLLVKCISLLTLGMVPAMKPQPENEPEWKKSLTAILVDLPVFIVFDNMAGTLKSDPLSANLACDILEFRAACGWAKASLDHEPAASP